MRPGVAVSIVGHVGAVMMTMLVWQAHTAIAPMGTQVVPVEIVDVADESNVRALSEDAPEGEQQADEAQEAAPEPAPAPTPAPTPPQPQRRNQQASDDFDAFLRNYDTRAGRRHTDGETADRSQQGVGPGTGPERVTLEARAAALVQAAMRRCWRMPADLPDPERLIVVLEFDINRNGTLNGQPRVVSPPPGSYAFDQPMRAAVEAAQRAVRVCDPYPFADDPVVGDHYEIWRTNRYRFALGQH